jgi:hypothetical protein
MLTLKRLLVIILLSLYSLSYGGTIDPNISDQKYLDFGSQFYCVVKLCGTYEDGSAFCASGVIDRKTFYINSGSCC